MKKRTAIILLILFFLSAKTSSVFAAPQGLTIIPTASEVTLQKTDTEAAVEITIINNTNQDVDLRLSTVDFGTLNETGGVAFLGQNKTDFESKYGLSQWITLEKDFLVLSKNQIQKVKVLIKNQESLSPGGHYAAVLAKVDTPNRQQKEVFLRPTLSSLLFVKKIGGERYNLLLKDVLAPSSPISLPKTVNLRFQNNGNIHVAPRGIASLIDPAGTTVAQGIINEGSAFVLPESFRLLPVHLSSLHFPYRIGTYHLHVQYRYDGRDDYAAKDITFFYLPPVWIGLGGLIVLSFTGFLWKRRMRKTQRKE